MTEITFILLIIAVFGAIMISLITEFFKGSRDKNNKAVPEKKADSPKQPNTKVSLKPKQEEASTKENTKIFLSYRRLDSADVSGRIYDRLTNKYGKGKVFKDVDSIPLGEDFREYIDLMVAKATVILVVIGPQWKGEEDGGAYKINDSRDFVRIEVASAIKRSIPVIPLLVANAKIPCEHTLPEDIRELAYRNGISVRPDPDFDNDIERLLSGLNKLSNKPDN